MTRATTPAFVASLLQFMDRGYIAYIIIGQTDRKILFIRPICFNTQARFSEKFTWECSNHARTDAECLYRHLLFIRIFREQHLFTRIHLLISLLVEMDVFVIGFRNYGFSMF